MRGAERKGWAYRRRSAANVAGSKPSDGPAFRSDNDLHQWRFEWRMVAAVTTGVIAAIGNFDLPLRYWPLVLLPAGLMFAFMRWHAWRNRRAGKRFSHYESDRLS